MPDLRDMTTGDRFSAEAFEQERESVWDSCRALNPNLAREAFDAQFDAELADMRREEAAAIRAMEVGE